jgi:hypothetical protein
MKKTVQLVPNS